MYAKIANTQRDLSTYDDCPKTFRRLDSSGSPDSVFGAGSLHRAGACADSGCCINAVRIACRNYIAPANVHANLPAGNANFHATANIHSGSTHPHAGAHNHCHPVAANTNRHASTYGDSAADADTASYANPTTATY